MSLYDKASLVQIPSGYKGGSPNGTLYSVLPANGDGDFDHTRATSATRVNKDGLIESVGSNVPRLDYPLIDGVVQDCPALLLEPSRTNYVTHSEAISNAPIKSGTFTDNFAISPDGSQNATKITATNTDPYFYQNFTFSSTTYTMSIYVKGIGNAVGKDFQMRIGGASPYDTFEIPSEWTRFTITKTVSASSSNFGLEIPNPAVSGDEVLVWGWQLEVGSYETSIIPTSGSAVTRNADVCNGAGTSAEFNDSEGVLFVECSLFTNSGEDNYLSIGDITGTRDSVELHFRTESNRIRGIIYSNNAVTVNISTYAVDKTNNNKIAFKYKDNDFAIWINGTEVITSSSGAAPLKLSNAQFADANNGNIWYGKCKQLMIFNEALSDSELQTLTSL